MVNGKGDPFWMVFNPDGQTPRHQHISKESAVTEARRLASLNKGTRFYVLASIGFAEVVDPVVWQEWSHDDFIPF